MRRWQLYEKDGVQFHIEAPQAFLHLAGQENPRPVAVNVHFVAVLDPALRHMDPCCDELLPQAQRHVTSDI